MKKLINKKINLALTIIFFVGLLFGIIFLFFISEVDKLIIQNEIEEYIKYINGEDINKFNAFISSFKNNFLYVTVTWITSITLIFAPITVFIIFYKGFITGFMFSSLIMVYGIKGFINSVLFIFPHEIINIITLLIFTVIMLSTSFKLIRSIYNNKNINLRVLFKKLILIYIFTLFIIVIISVLEIYINLPILRTFL